MIIRLHHAQIGILDGIPIPGYQRFEFRDPFGNGIEFIQRVSRGEPQGNVDAER